MRVLVAFDKFKQALSASDACKVAAEALRKSQPGWTLDLCPLTDGGEGFEEIVGAALGAETSELIVRGPRGAPVNAGLSLTQMDRLPVAARAQMDGEMELNGPGRVAVIEMARASGLTLLSPSQRDPWQTTTYGTGQLIRAARDQGVHAILLGIGGSATNDLGVGALCALGMEFYTPSGETLPAPAPVDWHRIGNLKRAALDPVPPLFIATDVSNPLLGTQGATTVYGPQKGLPTTQVSALEAACKSMAGLLCSHSGAPWSLTSTPGAGAAGGLAFGLVCALGARILPGFAFTAACLDLERRIDAADLVLTGEGCFDHSSLSGKGPGTLAVRASSLGKRVHVIAGRITIDALPGVWLHGLSKPGAGSPTAEDLARTAADLAEAVTRVAR